jgi:hypothetical protein
MAKVKNHPLDEVFGMADNVMDLTPSIIDGEYDDDHYEAPPVIVQQPPTPDDDVDKEIDADTKRIFDTAMLAYEDQTTQVEVVDPRYAARTAEVAAQYLSIALNSVALRAKTKAAKKASGAFVPYQNNVSGNNIIMADRNALLEALTERKKIEN